MKAYTYIEKGRFELLDKPRPQILDPKDAIVKVTLSSVCSSDLHIKHGSVPRYEEFWIKAKMLLPKCGFISNAGIDRSNLVLYRVLSKFSFQSCPPFVHEINACLPAGVMSPRSSRSMHRSILSFVQ